MFILGFLVGIIVGMLLSVYSYNYGKAPPVNGWIPENPSHWRLVSAEKCSRDSFYAIMTVETRSGYRKFRGSCTVWNNLETFQRCSSGEESVLANFWEEAKYKGMI